MKLEPHEMRLYKGAHLLIILRWIAISWVGLVTFIANNRDILTHDIELYFITSILVLENIISLLLLKRTKKSKNNKKLRTLRQIINFQISADWIALTYLLHYTGGMENPFIIAYIFHMVIASILLSRFDSYLQTTFAIILLSLLAFLEYSGKIPHNPINLDIFIEHNLYLDGFYIIRTIFVFVIISYVLVFMSNFIVTRLRKQEEAYRIANIQLQKKDAIKNEYVLRVTHDIKAHLAAIQSSLVVVVDKILGPVDDKNYDFINRAYSRTLKLTNFVNSLLKLTRMRLSGTMKMEVFSLKTILYKAVETVKSKAKEKSITLNCNIEPLIDKIYGNEFSIEELVTNLLFNAVKYTNEKGKVNLSAKDQAMNILVEVEDSGIGISQEELPKVFDEFFRASNAIKVDKDGTGLGLSISKQIIQTLGGKIWVESKEGVGTKFSFTLPKKNITVNKQDRE